MTISGISDSFNNMIDYPKPNIKSEDDFEKMLVQALDNKDEKQLKKVCTDFESIMLGLMFKQMKATVPESKLVPPSPGREMFESMLDEELMNQASKAKGIGLADVLYKQLSQQLKNTYKKTDD